MARTPPTGPRLNPGQELQRGEAIYTRNTRGQLGMQPDGNLVFYAGMSRLHDSTGKFIRFGNYSFPLWWSDTTIGNVAAMQTDGNFVVYSRTGKGQTPLWWSGTDGNPGAYLEIQDDGNMVVYRRDRVALWASNTAGWKRIQEVSNFKIAGDIITSAIKAPVEAAGAAATQAVQTAVNAAGFNVTVDPITIPIVGDVVNIITEAASQPFKLAEAIASGERLDQALIDNFKRDLQIIKDVAPYVQTVLSFVPGVGTGVAAAIGAGVALAEGKNIDEAVKSALRGALPGGPAAAAAFDAAVAVASGENVAKALIDAARTVVPPGLQKAFDVGVAIATGENIQNAIAKGLVDLAPAQLQSLVATGQKAVDSVPVLSDAIKTAAAGPEQTGFKLAAGILSQAGINEKALSAIRGKLDAVTRLGFDKALKAQTPRIAWLKNVTSSPPVVFTPPPAVQPLTQQQAELKLLAAFMVWGRDTTNTASKQQLLGTSWQWAAAMKGKMQPADTKLAAAINAWAKSPDDGALKKALIDAAQAWGQSKGVSPPRKPPAIKEPPKKQPPTIKAPLIVAGGSVRRYAPYPPMTARH